MFRALRALTSRRFYQYLLFLLIPGISLKRWLGVGAIGLALITVGVIFTLEISTGPAFISFFESVSLRNETPTLRGAVFIGLGVVGASVAAIGGLERDIDALLEDLILHGPRQVETLSNRARGG